ncbi:MAG: LysM repeat protein [Kiritimatiellia bacterium]|jgi:LysM repeat protein
MQSEIVRFDESSRSSLSDQPPGPGGVARALRTAAEAAGLDAPSELYNEALRFAGDAHFSEAMERLQLLLCLDENDIEALLLLAKVHVACQRWPQALTCLDKARAAGAIIPTTLRSAVEEHLRSDRAGQSEVRSAERARSDGEIDALRQEARRIRSENANLLGTVHSLGNETRRWAWATAGVASISILFIVVNLAFSGSSTPGVPPTADVPTVVAGAVVTPPIVDSNGDAEAAPSIAPASPGTATPTSSALALSAQEALQSAPGLDGAALEVAVASGNAVVSGRVETHLQLKRAEDVLTEISGITDVNIDKVNVLSRTKGASHVVVSGDSLSSIAYRYYGDASLAKTIMRANPKTLRGRANLQIGMNLKVPGID